MHTLTWIDYTGPRAIIRTLTTPNRETAKAAWWALAVAGNVVRLWNRDGTLAL